MSQSKRNRDANSLGKYFPDELRQRLSEDLHLTGKAQRTHNGYIRAVRQLSDFAKCSPDQVTELQNINTLPEVLTIKQVYRLILAATTKRMFVYFWTVYSVQGAMKFDCSRQWRTRHSQTDF